MPELEELKPGIKVKGIIPNQTVSVLDVKWHGSTAVELFYKQVDGQPVNNYSSETTRCGWEACILAHLFDPVLAVRTS